MRPAPGGRIAGGSICPCCTVTPHGSARAASPCPAMRPGGRMTPGSTRIGARSRRARRCAPRRALQPVSRRRRVGALAEHGDVISIGRPAAGWRPCPPACRPASAWRAARAGRPGRGSTATECGGVLIRAPSGPMRGLPRRVTLPPRQRRRSASSSRPSRRSRRGLPRRTRSRCPFRT